MTSRSTSTKNSSHKSSTTDSGTKSHSSHQHKKFNSNTSGASSTHYVALLGDEPTKITIKRYQASKTSKNVTRSKNSSSRSDEKQVANGRHSLKRSAVTSKPKESCVKTSAEKDDFVPSTSANRQSKKARIVEHLNKSNDATDSKIIQKNVTSTNDRKRTTKSKEKYPAKKSRKSADPQTVAAKPPTAVQAITGQASTGQAIVGLATTGQTTTVQANPMQTIAITQLSSTRRQILATAISSFSWKSANAIHQMRQHNNKFKQEIKSQPVSSFTPSPVTAIPPMPPNWINNYEDTIMSLLAYRKYEIDTSTAEYKTIESMLDPIQAIRIKKIVNPDLWKRFVNSRREMLRSKTDDLNVLSELGLDERDVMRCTHLVLNQSKNHLHKPYSDNMALLFHCTKNVNNLKNIFTQGLDERLCNAFGGRLGKGIYFADNPRKALQYDGTGRILVFAVLLGDCISVDHFPFKNALVREPEKNASEMRNLKDHFFDSIVGRPAGYNEYVIYNRHQCCPLYEIEFNRSVIENESANNSIDMDKNLPPFAWLPGDPSSNAMQNESENWPFYADELFRKMGAHLQDNKYFGDIAPLTESNTEPIDKRLATLFTFGFCDAERNREVLAKFDNDIYLTLNYLLENDHLPTSTEYDNLLTSTENDNSPTSTENSNQDTTSSANNQTSSTATTQTQLPVEVADFILELDADKAESTNPTLPEMVECSICCNEYESFDINPEQWKRLECGHKLCSACHAYMLTTRTTVSGVEQTFLKCPFCHFIMGVQIGTCPDIQMNVSIIPISCEGYESTNTISINYFVDSGYQLNRTAYLPNNDEGEEVLRLLKIACDRRLCFTIGESVTTGQKNVLVWGIHHKTSIRGGVLSYGYPDPGYMSRVKLELKSYGIQ